MVTGKWDSIYTNSSLPKYFLEFISFLGINLGFLFVCLFCFGFFFPFWWAWRGSTGQSGCSNKSRKISSKAPLLQLLPGVSHLIFKCDIYCLVTSVKTETKMISVEKPITHGYVVLDRNSSVHLGHTPGFVVFTLEHIYLR